MAVSTGDPRSTSAAALLLQDFMDFPAPLVLLRHDGQPELANARFTARFGDAALHSGCCEALAQDLEAGWRRVTLELDPAAPRRTSARSMRMAHHILLAVDEDTSEQRELTDLRLRLAELAHLAAIDPVSGAWTRAHLDRVLELELSRSTAMRQPLSLIVVELDGLGELRGREGPVLADAVLREFAGRLQSPLRGPQMLYHWSADQLVVLAASDGYRRAEAVAERLREAVERRPFGAAGRMTVSVGVCEYDGGEALASWFARLTTALARARTAGGARVIVDRRGNSDRWSAHGGAVLHLIWHEAYECGESRIDAQHRQLFALANNLIDASLADESAVSRTAAPFDDLMHFIGNHFSDEETLLQDLRYPDVDAHRRAHAALLRRARQMKALLEAGQLQVGMVVEFLAQDVVARHMLTSDVAFFPLLRAMRRRA